MRSTATTSWALLILMALLTAPAPCHAKISHGKCGTCHTMHNSQNGLAVTTSGDVTKPLASLLRYTCIGCHTGTNDGTNTTPYVLQTTAPVYGTTGTGSATNTLAGGNFYWVAQGGGDRTGHNVLSIAAEDGTLHLTPPGGTAMAAQIRCAGVYGCHGDRDRTNETQAIHGGHHGGAAVGEWCNPALHPSEPVPYSYRLLDGIEGLEDSHWEYRPEATQHNKYYGAARSGGTIEDAVSGTISSLCAKCHGDFHNGAGKVAVTSPSFQNVWLRHPTDFDLSDAAVSNSEYTSYNHSSAPPPYSVASPVATEDTSTTVNATVTLNGSDAIVMCISCHRAHGTPYSSILRWDYKSWPNSGTNGCAVCHTAKD